MGKSHHAATIQVVTPERFNPGSTPKSSGFPLKACGNDGLQECHNGTPNRIFEGAAEDVEKKFDIRNFRLCVLSASAVILDFEFSLRLSRASLWTPSGLPRGNLF